MADWMDLADRLEALSRDMLAAAPDAPDEIDDQLVQLHAVSLRHYAEYLRSFDR